MEEDNDMERRISSRERVSQLHFLGSVKKKSIDSTISTPRRYSHRSRNRRVRKLRPKPEPELTSRNEGPVPVREEFDGPTLSPIEASADERDDDNAPTGSYAPSYRSEEMRKSSKSSSSSKSSKGSSSSSTKSPTESPYPTATPAPSQYESSSKSSSKSSKGSKSSVETYPTASLSPTGTPSPSSSNPSSSKSSSKSSKGSTSTKSSKSSKGTLPPTNTPDDHYADACTKTDNGENIRCRSRMDFGLDGDWITLDSDLTCPTRLVDKYGIVDVSQRFNDMCSCNATLTTYVWYILNIVDTVSPVDCNCFGCAADTNLGQRSGFGYQNLSPQVLEAPCIGFDCEGRCNSTQGTILPPIVTPSPTEDPTAIPILVPTPTPQPSVVNPPTTPSTPPPTTASQPTDPPNSPAPPTQPGNVQSNTSGGASLNAIAGKYSPSSSSWLWIITTVLLYFMGNSRRQKGSSW